MAKGAYGFTKGLAPNVRNAIGDPEKIRNLALQGFNSFKEHLANARRAALEAGADIPDILKKQEAALNRLFKVGGNAAKGGFSSFNAFKKAYGPAGKGNAWHHIVEQHADNVAKFGAESIHTSSNVIKIPHGAGSIHAKVTGHYNSLMPGTSMRVRDYVKTLSYEKQYQYGIDVLKRFGWTP